MSKKAIIIGAGLAGLSAGIHLQQDGVQTEIFEISGQAGGMCITWERQGYRFDGCIDWMVGTKSGGPIYKLYTEVDALTPETVIYNTEFVCTEIDGVLHRIPLQVEAFKQFLLNLAPQDGKPIEGFCKELTTFMTTDMPAGAPSSLPELIHFMTHSGGFISLARKYGNTTVGEYAERFESQTLKKVLFSLMAPQFAFLALVMMLATRMSGNAGYPLDGALGVVQRMQAKYLALGGKLNLSTKVDRILVENGRVTGVIAKGERHSADAVVAACDAYDTLYNMLGGSFKHKQLDEMLQTAELFSPLTVVSFGLNRRFGIPYEVQYECPKGIETAPGFTTSSFLLSSFEFDPNAAPEGGSSIMVMIEAPLEYWVDLRKTDMVRYRAEKDTLAQRVAALLEERIPGIRNSIVVTDVATPATYIRYANLYKGSWEGFAPTPKVVRTTVKTTVEGVKGLVLAGQWVTPGGGLCTAVKSGKDAAKAVIKMK